MSLPFRRAKPSALAILAVAVLMIVRLPALADGQFVDGIEDLPLMPELQSVPAASVDFDGLAGRIVVAFAEGKVAMEDVRAFYDATLPQLGWDRLEADRWARAGEELSLDAVAERGGLVVRFELVPR
ncbi:hypothetical protein T8K17_04235 [Thalassobaculum sp. OXR-137]|uniref:hypothetical protein n=1 Tax=Thalassobaculum sp. OXR-137 TaxID=3100173 RepID=UPI002AC9CD90|nr:hypothetical protein [Thalassobaculum sp. OXR-137]WPZ35356.1 hypothetical protein T8K17_04235 [Thalassobaculum sp. OXR-137]